MKRIRGSFSLLFLFLVGSLSFFSIEARYHDRSDDPQEDSSTGSSYWEDIKLTATGGGANCAACTIVVSLLDQLAELHNKEVEQVVEEACQYFPAEIASICTYYVNLYGDIVIDLLVKNFTPDEVCLALKICTNPTCRMNPPSAYGNQLIRYVQDNPDTNKFAIKIEENRKKQQNLEMNPWEWIQWVIQQISDHKPPLDFDGDLFAVYETLRGSHWRGKDCNDRDKNRYPGRKPQTGEDPNIDYNCNGISKVDPKTKLPYEKLFCDDAKYKPMGTIVVGDSGGAHFSIPPSYMNASAIGKDTFKDILWVIADEFDRPHLSGYTGYKPSTDTVIVDSIYKRLWERNHCNHRDFQNVAVNGCRSGSMNSTVIRTMQRSQSLDRPALVFFELIGNDVCSPHPTLDTMTTVPKFRENILASLEYLDSTLPQGSHVVFVGLATGTVLYDVLHNRTHPIGVTYQTVYDFLNCLQISPCWVWMNSNETIRNAGQKRANELSAVYLEIIANRTYKNFDMAYYQFPFEGINEMWLKQGGQTWQLIEPIDGFHPNQIAHELMAKWFWNTLEQEHPEFLGPVNPNNAEIEKLFGNQGGY